MYVSQPSYSDGEVVALIELGIFNKPRGGGGGGGWICSYKLASPSRALTIGQIIALNQGAPAAVYLGEVAIQCRFTK